MKSKSKIAQNNVISKNRLSIDMSFKSETKNKSKVNNQNVAKTEEVTSKNITESDNETLERMPKNEIVEEGEKSLDTSSDESLSSQTSSGNSGSSSGSSSDSGTVQRGPVKLEDLDEEVLKYLSDYGDKISQAETTVYKKLNTYITDIEDKIKQTIEFINQEFQKDSHRNERFMKNIR